MAVAVYSIPLKARFRGITVREGMLIRGPSGWGEFSPFWDYGAAEARRWWAGAVEAAAGTWPAPLRNRIPVNCTVPAVTAEAAQQVVLDSGCRTAKVKIAEPGQSLGDDMERVAAVRDALGPDGAIRIDANGAWSVEKAVAAIAALDRAAGGLEYVEQPCKSLEEMAAVRLRVGVRLAADESIRRARDPLRVGVLGAADIAVLKVQPMGGVERALAIAERCGLPVVVSSALETSVGLAAGAALAAALPELPYACGLATGALLDGDVCADPLVPVDGFLPVRTVDPDLRTEMAADEATTRRWHKRLTAVVGPALRPERTA
ncbi:MAG: o-succinylbenzoate synthase [Actinomycetota bacterium]|nr:o-succinylbenzoate synthase [Actinomycetota bacterium]